MQSRQSLPYPTLPTLTRIPANSHDCTKTCYTKVESTDSFPLEPLSKRQFLGSDLATIDQVFMEYNSFEMNRQCLSAYPPTPYVPYRHGRSVLPAICNHPALQIDLGVSW